MRCSKCRWVHEADSVKQTSFMGVELCPLHAVAPEMLHLLRCVISENDGETEESWGNILDAIRDTIARAEGRE